MLRKQYIKLLVVIFLIGIFALILRAMHIIDNGEKFPVKKGENISFAEEKQKKESGRKIIYSVKESKKADRIETKNKSAKPAIVQVNSAKPSDKTWEDKFRIKISSEISYSDNVFHYSRDKISEYRQLSSPVKFQGVKSISDTYNKTKLEIDKRFRLFGDRLTTLKGFAEGTFYARNKSKNYGVYGVDIKQSLGSTKTVRMGYSFMPNYFLRTLFDDDYSGDARYRKAQYDKNRIFIRGWMKFAKDFSGWGEYDFIKEDYNKDFSERDNRENKISLGIRRDIGKKISLFAKGAFSDIDAKAHGDDVSQKPDISSRNYLAGTGINFRLNKKLGWDIYYNFQWVDFTTDNDIANDPYHRDRRDKKQDIGTELKYVLFKDSNISVGYKYRINDVKLGQNANTSLDYDELVGYVENIFFAKLSLSF